MNLSVKPGHIFCEYRGSSWLCIRSNQGGRFLNGSDVFRNYCVWTLWEFNKDKTKNSRRCRIKQQGRSTRRLRRSPKILRVGKKKAGPSSPPVISQKISKKISKPQWINPIARHEENPPSNQIAPILLVRLPAHQHWQHP